MYILNMYMTHEMGLTLRSEVMITELPEEKKEAAGAPGGHSHGMEGMY